MNSKGRRRSKKFSSFQPNRNDVSQAVENFLKSGGQIKKVETVSDTFKQFTAQKEMPALIDAYLMGESYY